MIDLFFTRGFLKRPLLFRDFSIYIYDFRHCIHPYILYINHTLYFVHVFLRVRVQYACGITRVVLRSLTLNPVTCRLALVQSKERIALHHYLHMGGLYPASEKRDRLSVDVGTLLGRFWIYRRSRGMTFESEFDWQAVLNRP